MQAAAGVADKDVSTGEPVENMALDDSSSDSSLLPTQSSVFGEDSSRDETPAILLRDMKLTYYSCRITFLSQDHDWGPLQQASNGIAHAWSTVCDEVTVEVLGATCFKLI